MTLDQLQVGQDAAGDRKAEEDKKQEQCDGTLTESSLKQMG